MFNSWLKYVVERLSVGPMRCVPAAAMLFLMLLGAGNQVRTTEARQLVALAAAEGRRRKESKTKACMASRHLTLIAVPRLDWVSAEG